MQDAAERAQQRGFAESRHAFEQNMPPRQQADEDTIDHVLLADNDLADFLAHLIQMTGGKLKYGLGMHVLILTVTRCDCLGVRYYNTRASCRPTIRLPI